MRKVLLLAVVAFLSYSSFAQGDIKNSSYLNLSWNRPIRTYGEDVDRPDEAKNRFKYITEDIAGSEHYGGSIEAGTTFYIHPTGFMDGFKAGFLVDFIDLGVNYFRFDDTTTKVNSGVEVIDQVENCVDLNVKYSLNIGAMATISPAKSLYFDLFFKMRPTFGVHYFKYPMRHIGTEYFSDIPPHAGTNATFEYQMKEDTGIGFGFNYSFGLNIRYSKVLLGGEIVMGKLNYKYDTQALDVKVYDTYAKVKLGIFFAE